MAGKRHVYGSTPLPSQMTDEQRETAELAEHIEDGESDAPQFSGDLGGIVSELTADYENQRKQIRRSRAKCRPGTKAYLDHCKLLDDLRRKHILSLRTLGLIPRSLAATLADRYEYTAVLAKDGTCAIRTFDTLAEAALWREAEQRVAARCAEFNRDVEREFELLKAAHSGSPHAEGKNEE